MNSKYLTILATGALSLAACSEKDHDIPALEGNESINFSTYVSRPQGRGQVTTENSLWDFGVFAYSTGNANYGGTHAPNFMYNQEVKRIGNAWTYAPVKYWPVNDGKVSFFAYSPYQESGMTSNIHSGDPCIDFEVSPGVVYHEDLVYAVAKDLTKNDGIVSFEFRHALSRIGFKGMHKLGEGAWVRINTIYLKSSLSGATLNLNTGEWSNPKVVEQTYKLIDESPMLETSKICGEEAVQLNSTDGYMMVLPTLMEAQYELTIDYTMNIKDSSLSGGVQYVDSEVTKKLSTEFKAGKAYNIVLQFGGDEDMQKVDFTTSVSDWAAEDDTLFDIGEKEDSEESMPSNIRLNGFNIEIDNPQQDFYCMLIKKDDETMRVSNVLKEVVNCAPGRVTIPHINIDYNKVEAGAEYYFVDDECNPIKGIGTIKMDLAYMQMTIETDSFFEIPMIGEEDAQVLIAWGDDSQSIPMNEIWWEEALHHYSSPGRYQVRVFSTETDTTECQIPMFNVYRTHDSKYWSAENLISIDTPLLYHPSENTSRIFWGAINLERVHPDVFINFKRTETFYEAFLGCKSLQRLPIGLFKHNRNAYNFASTFSYCEMLYDFEWVFVENEEEKATRFSELKKAIYVFHMFQNVGRLNADLCRTARGINFDEYDYPYGISTGSSVYGDSAAKFQNYDEIEKFYYHGD